VSPPSASAAPTAPSPPERAGVIERKGASRTLVGHELKVGDAAPAFDLVDPQLGRVRSQDLAGKVVLLSVVPSLDTPVCEAQTGHLAGEQDDLPENVVLLTVSRDLPFAQRRFLADNQIDTKMASDFDTAAFGKAWGLYIKETGLLARSLWVIGKDGKIAYRQIVREQASEPEYEPALVAARAAAEAP
jgi:thiol peroxidase